MLTVIKLILKGIILFFKLGSIVETFLGVKDDFSKIEEDYSQLIDIFD